MKKRLTDLPPEQEQIALNTAGLILLRGLFGEHKDKLLKEWRNLNIEMRSALCYTARLRPQHYANLGLDQMTWNEREAIRQAVLKLGMESRFHCGANTSAWHADAVATPVCNPEEKQKKELLRAARLRQQMRVLESLELSRQPRLYKEWGQ